MKKSTLIIALITSLLLYQKEAYAIFDPMATIETALELKDEVVTKVQEVQKLKSDLEKSVKQGYALASSCFKNPVKCGLKGITGLSKNGSKRIKMFPMMPGAVEILDKDLTKIKSEDVSDVVRSTYIYKQGKKSLVNLRENRDNINSVIANSAAILFAKGEMIRTMLHNEKEDEIYEDPSANGQGGTVDTIKYLQSKLEIINNTRLAHIIELKAHILDAQYTAELTQQSNK